MLTQISLTFGSREILQSIINKYPERHFKLMQANTHSNKLALFDLSGKESVFKSPVKLTVLDESLNASLDGILYYQSFQVNGDRQKLLNNSLQKIIEEPTDKMNGGLMLSVDNKVEANTLVLLTAWDNFEKLTAWKNSESFASLLTFTTRGSDNGYFDEIYKSTF